MRVSLSENQITITSREKGIVLIIDGTDNNTTAMGKALYDAIQPQVKEYNVPLRLGVLSWKDELSDISELMQMDITDIKKRGKFVTPLVEGFFKNIKDKEFDLLILYSGKVYDYTDWKQFLSSKFNDIYYINVEEELKAHTLPALKNSLVDKLFGSVIDEVIISFESQSIPYRFPENLLLQFDLEKKTFSLRYPKIKDIERPTKKMNIEIHTRGYQTESSLTVMAGNLLFNGSIRNDKFIQPARMPLSATDLQIFRQHIDALQQENPGQTRTYCPSCQKIETFYKPFFCQSKGKYILEPLDNLAKERQKIFLFINKNFEIISSSNEILEHEEGRFIFLSEGMVYEINSDNEYFQREELPKIFHGLYKLTDGGFVMLWV